MLMKRPAAPATGDWALLRERLAILDKQFGLLRGEGAAEAGRHLHTLLCRLDGAHSASVRHLWAVHESIARGVALLDAAAAESSQGEAPGAFWSVVKAYTGFEMIARATLNWLEHRPLTPETLKRIVTSCSSPPCTALAAPAPAGEALYGQADRASLLPILGLLVAELRPLLAWLEGEPVADWAGHLVLAQVISSATTRGLLGAAGPAACGVVQVRRLVDALVSVTAAWLGLLAGSDRPAGTTVEAAALVRAVAVERPSRPVPAPLPMEPFFRRYPGCEGLLYAIAERPWDDAPRLVFSDWLEEHGDEPAQARAAFIRLQCRLADSVMNSERQALQWQAQTLLEQYAAVWREGVPSLRQPHALDFERGLLERLSIDLSSRSPAASRPAVADVFRPIEDVLAKGGILVRSLAVAASYYARYGFHDWLAELVRSPRLAGLIALELSGYPDSIESLGAALPGGLTSLTLEHCSLRHGRSPLATPPWLSELSRLALLSCVIGDGGARDLAASPHLGRLHTLELATGRIGPAGTWALAESPHLGNLSCLDLRGNVIKTNGALALAGSSHLANLAQLELDWNMLGIAGTRPLVGGPGLRRLERLGLGHCTLGAAGMKELANSPHLPALISLDVGDNKITDRGTRHLVRSPVLERLTFLDLRNNEITDAGATALAASPGSSRLEFLILAGNQVSDEGVKALADSAHLSRLVYLDLRDNPITAAGVRVLAATPHLTRLASVVLEGNKAAEAAWRRSARAKERK
jgi:uncharacterized protein (TIGR02996 family)